MRASHKSGRPVHSGPHKSLATRRLQEGVKAAIADHLPQGRGKGKNKDSRLKQRYADFFFFRDGVVDYIDPQDPAGTSVRITNLDELAKRVTRPDLEVAKARILEARTQRARLERIKLAREIIPAPAPDQPLTTIYESNISIPRQALKKTWRLPSGADNRKVAKATIWDTYGLDISKAQLSTLPLEIRPTLHQHTAVPSLDASYWWTCGLRC